MREAADFDGRRILVTGGTRGIGEAIVHRLMGGGGNVITTGRSRRSGSSPDQFVQADVSTREGIDQVVKAVMDRLGGLDILIHNVGGSAAPGGGALALSDDDWQHAFYTNFFLAVRLDRYLLPTMPEARLGRDHLHLVHPANAATLRSDVSVRSGKGRADQLQQGPFKGGRSQGYSCEHSSAGIH
jgi:NAD(P)-dependent dehydrogenase (short-subunit alcohol dehydrogenase family)